MLELNQKNWNCPKKLAARQETIIDEYRRLFNRKSIPSSKQYWTMSGQCTDKNGTYLEGCELYQIVQEGLITPDQFYGVEINPEIVEDNKKAFPNTNWICSDFLEAMLVAKGEGNFNPAIVNADMVNLPLNVSYYLTDMMSLLSGCSGNIMLVVNMILEYGSIKSRSRSVEAIIEELNKIPSFSNIMRRGGWKFDQKAYIYGGTGQESRSTMETVVFYKK
jgi:hypothetical protein